jgi:sarcosine oxidase
VAAEATVQACCRLAEAHGAELHFHEEVRAFGQRGEHVEVTTTQGTYRAAALVVAAGPWSGRILAELSVPLVVQRIPHIWFPAGEQHTAARGAPCFLFDLPYGSFYGVPAVNGGRMKIGGGGARRAVPDPSRLDRQLHAEDLIELQRFIAECLPGVSSVPAESSMCMCTMTPDERFVVDRHPAQERVVIAAGFSGHGFKFCLAIGDLLADLASGALPSPLDPPAPLLRLRWGAPSPRRRGRHDSRPT